MLAITTRKYRSLPRIDGDTIGRLEAELSEALEKARVVLGDAPKKEHPIAREQREADENRRRLQKEFEAGDSSRPVRGGAKN